MILCLISNQNPGGEFAETKVQSWSTKPPFRGGGVNGMRCDDVPFVFFFLVGGRGSAY